MYLGGKGLYIAGFGSIVLSEGPLENSQIVAVLIHQKEIMPEKTN